MREQTSRSSRVVLYFISESQTPETTREFSRSAKVKVCLPRSLRYQWSAVLGLHEGVDVYSATVLQ